MFRLNELNINEWGLAGITSSTGRISSWSPFAQPMGLAEFSSELQNSASSEPPQ